MSSEPERGLTNETASNLRPQIWVGSLSDYNAGVLHGEWMDAARDAEDVHADIAALLARSPTAARDGLPAEEWGIFDFEGFGPLRIGEYEAIERICRWALGIGEHGLAYAAWVSERDGGDDKTSEAFEDAYLGRFDSLVEYVDQFVDDLGYEQLLDDAIPDSIRSYVEIRTDRLARDLELSGDVTTVEDGEGGIWLFEGNL